MTIVPLEPEFVVLGIAGLKPWAFFLIFFIVVAGGLIAFTSVWDSRKREKNRKLTTMPDGRTRRILGVFCTANSEAYEVLCDFELGEVTPPGSKEKASGKFVAPSKGNHTIPLYYTLPDFCFKTPWPKGAKPTQQIDIMESFYIENFQLPRLSYKQWTEKEMIEKTATLGATSADQSFSNAVVTEVQQKFTEFTKAVAKLKNLQLILILAAIGCLLGLFNLFYNFQGYTVLIAIRKFFLGN